MYKDFVKDKLAKSRSTIKQHYRQSSVAILTRSPESKLKFGLKYNLNMNKKINDQIIRNLKSSQRTHFKID